MSAHTINRIQDFSHDRIVGKAISAVGTDVRWKPYAKVQYHGHESATVELGFGFPSVSIRPSWDGNLQADVYEGRGGF